MRIIPRTEIPNLKEKRKMKLLFWLVYNLALGYNETVNPISLRSRETSAQFIDRLLSKLSFISYNRLAKYYRQPIICSYKNILSWI